jgi:hypothetical protein
MGRITTPTESSTGSNDKAESSVPPQSEVVSMNGLIPPSTPSIGTSDVPGAITLKELNESRPVTRMTIDEYRRLTQKQKDDLSGNYIEFPTAKQPVPALLVPIWNDLTNEQKLAFAGDPNSQTDLRITQYPSNERIADNEDKHAERRAAEEQARQEKQKPSTDAPKPDTTRLENLTKEYVNSVYSKFRGTDPKAPETELYKSLKNATDPEIVKIRELLYGKTDGGQDNDRGLYDVFRNGKESVEIVMKRLQNVPGSTVEEKLKYLEGAIEKVKQYKVDFEKPKVPQKPPPQTGPPPVNRSQSLLTEPSAGLGRSGGPGTNVTENRSVTFDPSNTEEVVAQLQAGEVLPIRSSEDLEVALSGLENAGEMEWYEYLEKQAALRVSNAGS